MDKQARFFLDDYFFAFERLLNGAFNGVFEVWINFSDGPIVLVSGLRFITQVANTFLIIQLSSMWYKYKLMSSGGT